MTIELVDTDLSSEGLNSCSPSDVQVCFVRRNKTFFVRNKVSSNHYRVNSMLVCY